MNILITGALGYIGSHVAVRLSKRKYNLTLIDNLYNSSKESLNKIEKVTGKKLDFIKTDIREKKQLKEILFEKKIEAIIHFAGLKSVKESEENPKEYFDVNVNGSKSLINAFEETNKANKIFIFSSSATIYGKPRLLPCKESHEENPENVYGQTKKEVENFLKLKSKSNTNKWKIASLRYFNPIGANSSGLIGDNPKGFPENLLPVISKVAKGEIKKLKVFGSNYPTKDGTAIRDYIHVEDLADGHISALNYLEKKRKNIYDIFNLGTGKGYSVLEIIKRFEKINKVSVPFEFLSERRGDVPINFADVSKAESILKWKVKKNLNQMIQSSWFHEMNLNED